MGRHVLAHRPVTTLRLTERRQAMERWSLVPSQRPPQQPPSFPYVGTMKTKYFTKVVRVTVNLENMENRYIRPILRGAVWGRGET